MQYNITTNNNSNMTDNEITSPKNNKRAKRKPRPYNHYNLYFILERELFLQQRGIFPSTDQITPDAEALRSQQVLSQSLVSIVEPQQVNYNDIEIPTLPSRYSSLVLPKDWFVHKKKKRAHVKTHGLVSFREMAAMVASRWKQEDQEIILYVKTVVEKIKQRTDELKGQLNLEGPLHHEAVLLDPTTSIERNLVQVPVFPTSSTMEVPPVTSQFLTALSIRRYAQPDGLCPYVSETERAPSTGSISSSGSHAKMSDEEMFANKNQVDITDDEIMLMWRSQ